VGCTDFDGAIGGIIDSPSSFSPIPDGSDEGCAEGPVGTDKVERLWDVDGVVEGFPLGTFYGPHSFERPPWMLPSLVP
jgi:hypothetical protein